MQMPGTYVVTRGPSLSLHTYIAPEDGWRVTSHIIEFSTQLFIVDAQYTLLFAREVEQYAVGLGKPLTRLYVTHYHPDHLLGTAAFDTPLYSLSSVADKIAAAGDRVASEEHAKVGDDIPDHARRVDHRIEEGEETVDGVRILHRRVRNAETKDALVIALPEADAIIVQDLVYNKSHPFLGERAFEDWKTALREHRALPYGNVLPGHGNPGGLELYDHMIEYLDFAETALKDAGDAAGLRRALVSRFPDYGGLKVLDQQMRFLFRPAEPAPPT
jgi:glyoxylase-like metal-dependent hydrolase (beta-lactamase superfamily II)